MNRCAEYISSRLRDETGVINFITLALSLPVLLLLVLGSLDLFLYFRTTAVLERAASEAAQALAAAQPGKPGDFSTYSLPGVTNKLLYTSSTGGNTESDYGTSFAKHGKLFVPASSSISGARTEKIPFDLDAQPELAVGNASVSYTDGVQYLPRVHVPACLEPYNETLVSLNPKFCRKIGLLRYELPSKMDFDGDGREDVVFFNSAGTENFWVLLSSAGGLFRKALRFSLPIEFESPSATSPLLPCPADYDGDQITDFCTTRLDPDNDALYVSISLSSTYFNFTLTEKLGNVYASQVIPVPGRWTANAGQDQFAYVVLQGTKLASHLSTVVFPTLQADGAGTGAFETYTFDQAGTAYDSDWFKPEHGRYWRPVFNDHDGDGAIDIGWFTWDGGNEMFAVAGTGSAGVATVDSSAALSATIMPWQLFYPGSSDAPGLYIVERYNHRISIITKGKDNVVNADFSSSSTEEWRRVAGEQSPSGTTTTPPNLDPLSAGRFNSDGVPSAEGDDGCTTCEGGGNFNGDSGAANQTALNSPRAVFSEGSFGAPLYIADYGNYRVRKVVETGGDGFIDGTDSEEISTVVGGVVAAGVSCPDIESGGSASLDRKIFGERTMRAMLAWPNENQELFSGGSGSDYGAAPPEDIPVEEAESKTAEGPVEGEASLPWNSYTTASQTAGIHPSCVRVRPLALAVDNDPSFSQAEMFVADEGGAIFRVLSGADKIFNNDTTERMYRYIGTYADWTISPPAAGDAPGSIKLGLPNALAFRDPGGTGEKYLLIGVSHLGVPVAGNSADTTGGGVIVVGSGADRSWGSNDDTVKNVWGTWAQQAVLPQLHAQSTALNLRNPTGLAVLPTNLSLYGEPLVAYASGWWIDSKYSTGYEQSLIQLTPVYAKWINNPHNKHWGAMPPTQERGPYRFQYDDRKPLGTVPVEPSGGVAVSPDGEFLYFSETTRGMIQAVRLDRDLDGVPDATDTDIDGDGSLNSAEVTAGTDPWISNSPGNKWRTARTFADARMWAVSPHGTQMNAAGTKVDRLEWLLDRYGSTSSVPDAVTASLPTGQEAPYLLLNDETVAYAAPRGVLHGTPVWSGGIDRSTEMNGTRARLAPLVLGSPTPNEYHVKGVSGYDHCSDWTMDEDGATGLTNLGAPTTTCGRDINTDNIEGYTLGLRRAHLAHWSNQWHNYNGVAATTLDNSSEGHLILLDVNGSAGRDPAVFNAWNTVVDTTPFMVHMRGCFSDTVQSELDSLAATAAEMYSITMDSDLYGQARCRTDRPFFSADDLTSSSLMADTHAEWDVVTSSSLVDYAAVTSNRLSLGTDGDGDVSGSIGPVAETAYRVLEQSLRVDAREDKTNDYGASVEFGAADSAGNVKLTISYVYPLTPYVSLLYGRDKLIVQKSSDYPVYNHGDGS